MARMFASDFEFEMVLPNQSQTATSTITGTPSGTHAFAIHAFAIHQRERSLLAVQSEMVWDLHRQHARLGLWALRMH